MLIDSDLKFSFGIASTSFAIKIKPVFITRKSELSVRKALKLQEKIQDYRDFSLFHPLRSPYLR